MAISRAQLAESWGVDLSTISRAVGRAKLHKKHGEGFTEADLKKMRVHISKLRIVQGDVQEDAETGAQNVQESPAQIARKPRTKARANVQENVQQDAQTDAQKDARIVQLEAQIERLNKRVNLLTEGFTRDHNAIAALSAQAHLIIAWGRNTARIVRHLWHKSEDYRAGYTPPELPAITTKDVLDEDGQRTEHLLKELEQENSAWAETLKNLVRKSA